MPHDGVGGVDVSGNRENGGAGRGHSGGAGATASHADVDVEALALGLNAALAKNGTPERAEYEKKYLKSSLPHHGTTVPVVRQLVKALLRAQPDLTRPQLLAIAEELWELGVHEARAAAAELLAIRESCLTPDDLPLLTRLLREARTWALVDELAARVVGPLRSRYPETDVTLAAWATDPDFWLRRAALLAYLLPLRRGEEVFERFAQLADQLLEEREFFIRKAIGWALRERGKVAPEEVYTWLRPRLARTSGLTLREALKYLKPEQVALLKAASSATT